jgi:amino acid adenylation domain-containing protein
MLHIKNATEARRALLTKYMRGDVLKPATPLERIARRTQEGPVILSFGQQQLWLLAQLMPDTPVYTECVTIHLPGPLSVTALEQSYNEILRRHEAWRTSFPLVDGQPVQLIHPAAPVSLPLVDLRHLPTAERETEALRLVAEDAQRPFDLVNGPLQRAMLVRLGDEQHQLLLTLHHIIFDGFSLYQVFLPELRTLYEAFAQGQTSPLPELPIQYADFTLWQRKRMQGEMLSEQLDYWKKQLANVPELLALPTDHPRPATPSYRGMIHQMVLSESLTRALRDLSRKEGVTLYTTLLAAFNTLLYRYSGQDDILVGTASAGRNRSEFQHMLGVFINMLVLRTPITGDLSFRDLLRREQAITLEAQAYQDVPFEYLVKELQPKRSAGQNPLFQVLLILEPPVTAHLSGWTVTHMGGETGTAKFDLSLIIEERPEGLICRFGYSTELSDASTIARMAGHWQTLLQSIVRDPSQTIGQLPLLTEAERQQILVDWNATTVHYPKDICLNQLIEAQVKRTPDAIAVTFKSEQLTYQELNQRANQLAHSLQRMGVGPEVLVGVCMERSLEMVVALLGVLKAGGAYVPLDPAYPSERLAFMLEDAQVPVILTQAPVAATLPACQAHVICLDADWAQVAHEDTTNPVSAVAADNLAYVIYTSGSTGQPKGAMNTHRGICNYLLWMQDTYQLTEADRVLQKTPFSFDVSVWEFFWPLMTGARLVVARPEGHRDSAYLISLIQEQKITILHFGPSMLQVFLEEPGLEHCSSLRQVMCGGEALPYELQERFFTRHSAVLHNRYGPTEATINVTYWPCQRWDHRRIVPIGTPIANSRIYLLDPYGHPVPIGIAGELYIGGVGVARGYLNRPQLTAERFVHDPFSTEPGMHLYRTGDSARYLPDGTIEYLGRIDRQVKIRGFRIELGEIEEVLRQHPTVREAVVVAREDTPGNKYLVAYIVPTQEHASTTTSIHAYLKEKLPVYMVPASFMMLDALPLTPSGKVDRRALLAPDMSQRTVEETFAIPTQLIHFQLIKIWEELLDARPIGMRDNFFFLGGHSLLAARLVARIEQVFGKKIPLATLFTQPTIEQLTKVLVGREDIHPSSSIVAVQATGTKRPFFYLHGDYKSGAFYCLLLARDLGSDQPFYALDPPKFDGLQFPSSLEEMAATNIQLLRTVQPEGPYLLGGFCNGGLIAYEMARQLHTQGESVDLLLLIDPTPVGYARLLYRMVNRFGNLLGLSQHKQHYLFLWLRHAYRYLLHFYRYSKYPHYRGLQTELNAEQIYTEGGIVAALKSLFELQCGQGIEHLQTDRQIVSGSKHGTLRAALLRLRSIFPEALFPPFETLSHNWEGMFHWSAADYVPDFYPGKSTFFFFWDGERRKKKWQKVAQVKDKEVEIHTVAGTHDTCKTEYLHHFTERLHLCLSKAQAVTSDS